MEKVTVHDVYGNCVYLAKVQGVVVRDSKLTRSPWLAMWLASSTAARLSDFPCADDFRSTVV